MEKDKGKQINLPNPHTGTLLTPRTLISIPQDFQNSMMKWLPYQNFHVLHSRKDNAGKKLRTVSWLIRGSRCLCGFLSSAVESCPEIDLLEGLKFFLHKTSFSFFQFSAAPEEYLRLKHKHGFSKDILVFNKTEKRNRYAFWEWQFSSYSLLLSQGKIALGCHDILPFKTRGKLDRLSKERFSGYGHIWEGSVKQCMTSFLLH